VTKNVTNAEIGDISPGIVTDTGGIRNSNVKHAQKVFTTGPKTVWEVLETEWNNRTKRI
jgi:hypothetical protein